jgi:hypothetical protein
MTVRSTNSAPRGTVNLPALAQPKAEPKKSSGRQNVHSSFDRSGLIGAQGSKQGSKDIGDLWSPPSLPTKGVGGLIGKGLNALPSKKVSKEVHAGVSVAEANGSFSTAGGHVSGGYHASVLEASASASGQASIGLGKIEASGKVHAQATVVDFTAHAEANFGPLKANAQAEAFVGAKADAEGSISFDPLHGSLGISAKGSAFVGAKAGVSGQVKLGDYVGVHGGVEGMAGVGIKAGISAGLSKGHLKFQFEFGFALGIGGKISFGFDVNFKKIGEAVKNFIKKPIEFAKKAAKKVGDFFKGGPKKVKEGLKKAGTLWQTGKEPQRARAEALRARERFAKLEKPQRVAEIDAWLQARPESSRPAAPAKSPQRRRR